MTGSFASVARSRLTLLKVNLSCYTMTLFYPSDGAIHFVTSLTPSIYLGGDRLGDIWGQSTAGHPMCNESTSKQGYTQRLSDLYMSYKSAGCALHYRDPRPWLCRGDPGKATLYLKEVDDSSSFPASGVRGAGTKPTILGGIVSWRQVWRYTSAGVSKVRR